ncbi:MAG: Glutaminase [Rubritepida sp.]|nr:Glutaminase [Rubritepida sp.]
MDRPNLPRSPASIEIQALVVRLHATHAGDLTGHLADYIPELAKADPAGFGIAIAHASGEVVTAGDALTPFTIQSVSKALTLAMLLDLVGREETYSAVGVQPSGDPFNAIMLDPRTKRPFNPMVNAGAIAVAGRLRETLGPDAFTQILACLGEAAGRELQVDQAVFESERETGHRNRAIGHLLRAADVFTVPVDDVLDLYFRQCSLLVTATDLAVMGATLANIGTNPVTRRDVFGMEAVRETLSVMFTCGMYDGAGDWACRVGLPAKSGVGGGIMAVVNRQLGIGVYSPLLDAAGNSVRGQACCAGLAEELGLHAFDSTNSGSSFFSGMGHAP